MMRILLIITLLLLIASADTVSADNDSLPASAPKLKDSVRLVAVGDILLGRGIGTRIKKFGTSWLLENVEQTLLNGDICFGNLESPLTLRNNKNATGFVSRGDPKMAEVFSDAGFKALAVANNHSMDQNQGGLEDTINNLLKAGIAPVGGGIGPDEPYQARYVESNGLKIAFIGAQNIIPSDTAPRMAGIARLDTHHQLIEVKKAAQKADFVVVSLHWGKVNSHYPESSQIELAHKLVDSGADLILGHHPHVLQGMERYNGALIAYSLGNFAFDQNDDVTKRSVILLVDLMRNGKVSDPIVIPIRLDDFRPVIDSTSNGLKTLDELSEYGRAFGINGITNFATISFDTVLNPVPPDKSNEQDKHDQEKPNENLPPGVF
jgi:poly-gamma-glutamate synthesis protein (capsule biosynthesis protein)